MQHTTVQSSTTRAQSCSCVGKRRRYLHIIAVLLICTSHGTGFDLQRSLCRVPRVVVHEGAQASRHRKHNRTKHESSGEQASWCVWVCAHCVTDHPQSPHARQRHHSQRMHQAGRTTSLQRAAASTVKAWRCAHDVRCVYAPTPPQGLIPRATELIRLGGGFFLAFGPFIALISLVFSVIYLVLGDSFVHGGSPVSAPPPYVDPYDLLNEPTVDPMVPLR